MQYFCNICNKKYSSYKSLWLHNYKFHNTKNLKNPQNVLITTNKENSELICEYCKKNLSRKDNLKRHQIKCKNKEHLEKMNNEEISKMKLEILNFQKILHDKSIIYI